MTIVTVIKRKKKIHFLKPEVFGGSAELGDKICPYYIDSILTWNQEVRAVI